MAVRGRTKNGRKKRTEGGKTVRDPQWSRTLMPYFTVALKQSPRDAKRPTGWRGSIFRLTRDQISTLFFALSTTPSSFFLRGQQQQEHRTCTDAYVRNANGLPRLLLTLMHEVECRGSLYLSGKRIARQVVRNAEHSQKN